MLIYIMEKILKPLITTGETRGEARGQAKAHRSSRPGSRTSDAKGSYSPVKKRNPETRLPVSSG